jgi:D-alanyl-D-alanine carboxypeptidase/D-alanyl-D-alanine-endopeptidase (penicillin-binding protein 4)
MTRWIRSLSLLMLIAILANFSTEAATRSKRRAKPRKPVVVNLVWHVETIDGKVIASHQADTAINPASVIKAATSLWALETLGPDYRFETRFLTIANPNSSGTLHGDLFVQGARDPDFQPENAFLVARELNRLGIETIDGSLVVNRDFWIGYEGGSEGRELDPIRRSLQMAARLRQAFDPSAWTRAMQRSWRDTAMRHGFDPASPPRVIVTGGLQETTSPLPGVTVATHRSRPILEVLHAFNAYSNNDIERIGEILGGAGELSRWLVTRLGLPSGALALETTSGLGTNRLSPRHMVQLVRELKTTSERLQLQLDDVLGAAGCVPGTVSSFFQAVANSAPGSVIGKTGTLTHTDGGVSVFAGIARTARGPLVFSVAAPSASGKLKSARFKQQEWMINLAARHGGLVPQLCGSPLTSPDTGAEVVATPTSTAVSSAR